MWVPGGYLVYILMEKVPGREVAEIWLDISNEEKDSLRKCFKEALL